MILVGLDCSQCGRTKLTSVAALSEPLADPSEQVSTGLGALIQLVSQYVFGVKLNHFFCPSLRSAPHAYADGSGEAKIGSEGRIAPYRQYIGIAAISSKVEVSAMLS